MAELAVELTAPIAGLMEAGAGGSTTTGAGRFADRGGYWTGTARLMPRTH
jgi:hypothetical protein